MKIIADLHIHSRFAMACSKDLTLTNLGIWGVKKGISLLGTGDFTHPSWMAELKSGLQEEVDGLYKIKGQSNSPFFMLTGEIASVYKQDGKVRRLHNLVFSPNLSVAKKFIQSLEKRGVNLRSDGRPIMGISGIELMKIAKDVNEKMEIVPAHIWTPHFGAFGSLSGFDSLQEAYGNLSKHILAIETGLSSNPAMNHLVPALHDVSLISNSDAHSLRKLGREANVFAVVDNKLSYLEIVRIIRERKHKEFLETLEFYPEEGKYHLDGHANCEYSSTPKETIRHNGLCPVCGKKLLRGVLSRVDELAKVDTMAKVGNSHKNSSLTKTQFIPFRSIIPLEEIIAETFGMGVNSKKVQQQYETMVAHQPELEILLETSHAEISEHFGKNLADAIVRVRQGKVRVVPGYDGIFGQIKIFSEKDRESFLNKHLRVPRKKDKSLV